MKTNIYLFLLILALCASLGTAQPRDSKNAAQTTAPAATLSGKVASPAGVGVPSAEVNSANIVTGEIQQTITDAQGRYSFTLPNGRYIIAPAMPGFLVNPSVRFVEHNGETNNVDFEASLFAQTQTAAANDFDGDRKADVSVFRSSTANWYIAPSSSPNNFSAPQSFTSVQWGLPTDRITPADFDGDGKNDVAVWRSADANNPNKSFFYILNSSNNTLRAEQFGSPNDLPFLVGDWDGDGKADPAVYRGGTTANPQSYFFYRPSSAPAVDYQTVYWGIIGDRPVRGDFDGDGLLDAAVFRPSDRVWYVLQSSNNQPRYAHWGLPTDKFVPADYDGDGKTDLAVFRSGVWYIRQSSDNQLRYVSWGLNTDALVPADYDGDGETDIAVFRAGVWYILQSSSGQMRTANFGLTNDTPVQTSSFFNLID